jgi:hypothetical protein
VVELAVTPHEAQHLIVVGSSLRKPANILEAHLASLRWQVLPRNTSFVYCFVDDGLEPDARALVEAFVQERGGTILGTAQTTPDFSDQGVSHTWTDSAMQRVGRHKDAILDWARSVRAEAVWFCDADLICDPMTFTDLWSIPEQIVCAVYWTRWAKAPAEHPPVHAGPQVWQRHPYTLSGNGMEEWELRRRLINREIVHVYGQGACTLIRREALAKGVSFAPMPENTGPGLMQGEDRHFCLRAEQLHIKMVASGWPDIFHIYHRPDDEALIPQMLERLGRDELGHEHIDTGLGGSDFRPSRPRLGDLVSLDLHPLELIVWPPPENPSGSRWLQHAPPHLVRGKLGRLALVPELEDAVLQMTRGEVRVVPVHFPLDYPFEQYRGQRRLIRVTLIDHKPFGFPPVVEDELLVNRIGGALDTTTLTPELIEQIKEVHAA